VTRIAPDETCSACGSVLVPQELASGFRMSKDADHVCLKCGRAYQSVGNAPRLVFLGVAAEREEDDR